MKKLLLFVSVLVLTLTLSACDGDLELTESITDVEAAIVDVEADITALETSVTAAEADITTAKADITALKASVSAIETDITALETDTTANEEAITALQTALDAIDARLAVLDLMTVDMMKDLLTTKIVLMYNNDVHGRVNDDGYSGVMGYATIKNIIDELRSVYDNTFLVSAGDMFHGTTFATLENGESFVEVMNEVGYDLMVPGNHDFDFGQEQLLVLEGLADFPLISSNIQYGSGHDSYMADDGDDETDEINDMFDTYHIEMFGDVKVGFFGLTTPDTVTMTHPANVIEIDFLNPITQAQSMVDMLEEMEVDVIVCLGHIGLDDNDSMTSEMIIEAVDGIDVFVDGHSHSYLPEGFMVNDTLIVSTGEYNKNFGVLELTVEDGMVIDSNNLLISADEAAILDLGTDQDVQDVIDAIVVEQEVLLSVVVGKTAVELDGLRDNVRTGETNLGKIIADSMIEASGADVAITNGGGIRETIAAGDVTRGDVITVLPFGNIIVTVTLTGQEIVDTLEYGTSSYPGSSGKFPHVSGITYTIDPNNAKGERVIDVMINGVAVDLAATYNVATNDFMAAGGDGYIALGEAPVTAEYMGLHEAFEDMFTVDVDIVIPTDVRVTVLPETFVFISEYVDGAGNNKALEIYNPTDEAITLSGYRIDVYSNGSEDAGNTIDLTAVTIAAGEVYVITNPNADNAEVLAASDVTGTVTYFNGDDAITLVKHDVVIDAIGVVGEDGDNDTNKWWIIDGDDNTADVTLVRAATVLTPNGTWTPGEWEVLAYETYSSLGAHTVTTE